MPMLYLKHKEGQRTREKQNLSKQKYMIKEIITMKKNAIIYIDDTHAQVTTAF